MRINRSFINVYKKKNNKSGVVTQLLYGDSFKKIKKKGSWIKIENDKDRYKGFIKKDLFLINEKSTHKVFNLSAQLYKTPNVKNKIKKKISFGSKIKIKETKKGFCKFDNYWIKKKNLKKIDYKNKDIFKYAKKFLNVKYRWGGKHFTGIDCSALVQLLFNFNNKYCPRDSKDQVKFFKNEIKLKDIRKNDLIFWKGHVAIAVSKNQLIHAYGPFKKTVVMSIKETIDRIQKTANLKVICVKRIS